MAITKKQLLDLGFVYSKRKKDTGNREYDTLMFRLNKTDYLYLGYNSFTKRVDYKRLWKRFYNPETKETVSYPIDRLGELSFSSLKDFIETEYIVAQNRERYYEGN